MTDIAAISAPLPWQGKVWQHLRDLGEAHRLPHAMLFAGPAGSGKQQFALALARLLLCHQPVDGLNCGRCHACELSRAGNHGDFLVLEPEQNSRVIKVDQVRRLVEFAGKRASFGVSKVMILNPAEAMNINAANALLKCLEEPPENTYFLLVSSRPQRLPATVRSRCRLSRLNGPDSDNALAYVTAITGDQDRATELLALAGGQPLAAAALYLELDKAEQLADTHKALAALMAGTLDPVATLEVVRNLEPQLLVSTAADFIQQQIKQLAGAGNSPGDLKTLFGALDTARQYQRILESGSNPNPQLISARLLETVADSLGGR